jgi:phenylacetate-CoA ligase
MFWFGKSIRDHEYFWENENLWIELEALKKELFQTQTEDILNVLDSFSKFWSEDGELFNKAYAGLLNTNQMTSDEIKKTLLFIKPLFSKENLRKRLSAEFHPVSQLDHFVKTPGFSGEVRAIPLGVLLHVTAGNVFLSGIDSLVMGLMTKNLNIIKVSGQNLFFPLFFAEELNKFDVKKTLSNKFAIIHWKGGDERAELKFKKKVNGILAWGGEEMISSYSKDIPQDVKVIKFGPKISFQLISSKGIEGKSYAEVAKKIVDDIIPWDQSACSSPQNLFLEEGVDKETLLSHLENEFSKVSKNDKKNPDVAVEILKEFYRAQYSELMDGERCIMGSDFLIHSEKNKFLRPSPLHRSLIVKRYSNLSDLLQHISPFSFYLQSCSYLLDENEKYDYLDCLSVCGVKRFAPVGTVTQGMYGAPHDGLYVLRELVRFIGNEDRIASLNQGNSTLFSSLELKDVFESTQHPKGYIFSSGGTTGEPKYVHFSFEEFDHMTDMLAHNLRAQGVEAGMVVANQFVAGNLWSSFIAVDRALEKIGAINLPIGGLCQEENIVRYLKKFKPDVLLGIPSLIILNAEYCQKNKIELHIPRILYAGEAMTQSRMSYLKELWGVNFFGSAGYASVDAGVIGFQCKDCKEGEHHLFSDQVEMKIIDGEAVVSSLFRKTMPIKNYRTGDRVEWVENTCSFPEKKFKLLGRIDNLIQIWSTRINLDDIAQAIEKTFESLKTFQVVLKEVSAEGRVYESFEIYLEAEESSSGEALLREIYCESRDVKDTISFEQFSKKSKIIFVGEGNIQRNSRTGKISLIKDLRN